MDNSVEANAGAHRELLQSIQALDYAKPTLAQVSAQLARTKEEIKAEQAKLKQYQEATRKEFKDWEDIKTRTHKRLWIKMKHPGQHKETLSGLEEKEEKEYVEAFGREQSCRNRLELLERQRAELTVAADELKPFVEQHAKLRAQLEDLYKRVFDGPTPAHPEEDQAERAYHNSMYNFDTLQTQLTKETRAQLLVDHAAKYMVAAVRACRSAESYSQWDMMGGGTMTDMMERSELANAQRASDQARLCVEQARVLSPQLPGLAGVRVAQGNIMSDVFFDNIFTDYNFHRRIQASAAELQRQALGLQQILLHSAQRVGELQRQTRQAGADLESAREVLETTRETIMVNAGNAPPPVYAAE